MRRGDTSRRVRPLPSSGGRDPWDPGVPGEFTAARRSLRPGGRSVPPWDLHSPSRRGAHGPAPAPGDVVGRGTGHAQKTMSDYLGTLESSFVWLEKLVFVPPAHATAE